MYLIKAGDFESKDSIPLTRKGQSQDFERAKHGIDSVKNNASDDNRYERKTSTSGQPYFILKAGNGESIGRSETYLSVSAMETGITSVKNNAPGALTEDLT